MNYSNIGFSEENITKIREDFPMLKTKIYNKDLVYLDSAATSQKPISVLKAELDFLEHKNAVIHRGIHYLAAQASELYEEVRLKVSKFIGSIDENQIIYTKSATESLNLLSYSFSEPGAENIFGRKLDSRDVILVTELEHHANLIPWQKLAQRTGAKLEWIKFDENAELIINEKEISSNTKIVAFTHSSNVSATKVNAKKIINIAKKLGAVTVLDACQSVPHEKINVNELDVDFVAFSGHKMLAPYGIGILYGKLSLLKKLPTFLTGGSMVKDVEMQKATFLDPPYKFEAGITAVSQVIGLGAAIDYINNLGIEKIQQYESYLSDYLFNSLKDIPNLNILGPKKQELRSGLVSFTIDNVHSHDIGQILDSEGIAVRVGHHCAIPLHKKLKINSSARASIYLYNTISEIDKLVEGIWKIKNFFKV